MNQQQNDEPQRYRHEGKTVLIDIRVRQWRQLFDSRDPAPFRDRDLDDEAVAYIVNSFREVRRHGHAKLVLHLAETRESSIGPDVFVDAIHAFFKHEAHLMLGRRRDTLRRGRVALLIGSLFLGACVTLGQWIARVDFGMVAKPLQEGLTILGWVALWRPFDILLYEWWPLSDQLAVFNHLSRIPVDVIYGSTSNA